MNLTRGGADKRPFEYACHEGNYGMENMLNAPQGGTGRGGERLN